jgi:quinol-cytochrome oxidoreductase complex cytochrome b subunit
MLLILSTIIAFGIVGLGLAYLAWANKNNRRSIVSRTIWLATTAVIFIWAYIAAFLMSTPEGTDMYAFIAIALGLAACFMTFRLCRSRLQVRQ